MALFQSLYQTIKEISLLSPLPLQDNSEYLDYSIKQTVNLSKASLIFGLIFNLLFTILESKLNPSIIKEIIIIRVGIITPLLLFLLLLLTKFRKKYSKYLHLFISPIIIICAYVQLSIPLFGIVDANYILNSTIILLLFVYFFSSLKYRYKFIVSWIVILGTTYMEIFRLGNNAIEITFHISVLLGIHGIGILAGFFTEKMQINEFFQIDDLATQHKAAIKSKMKTEKLNKFAKQISESNETREILDLVANYFNREYNITDVWLMLYDKKKKILNTHYVYGTTLSAENYKYLKKISIVIDAPKSIIISVFKKKKSIFLKKIPLHRMNTSGLDYEIINKLNLKSLFHIPLIIKGEVIGIMAITDLKDRLMLTKEERLEIEHFCQQISGSIYGTSIFDDLQVEKEKSEKLLLNILPEKVASQLKDTGASEPVLIDSVSILFADIKDFTVIAEKTNPKQLTQILNAIFLQFDYICERNNIEKLKTIGDAYMCAGGIPETNKTHYIDICRAALEMRRFMNEMKELRLEAGEEGFWNMRIGIHSGPVIAGVIGKNKFTYDVWGDTVNTASRMEAACEPGRINISKVTYELVKYFFHCEPRGKVAVKNKSDIEMFFLEGFKQKYTQYSDSFFPNEEFHKFYKSLKEGKKVKYKREL